MSLLSLENSNCSIDVTARRVLITIDHQERKRDTHNPDNKSNNDNTATGSWRCLSSAILNGGLEEFHTTSSSSSSGALYVLNAKVGSDYDGVNPSPEDLTRRIAEEEIVKLEQQSHQQQQHHQVVGLLTAASLVDTVRVASRSAGYSSQQPHRRVIVDVIVTAGISNAKAAGSPAEYLLFTTDTAAEVGTINTIIITNAVLDDRTLIDAHATAVEAKCRASQTMGIVCHTTGALATGTGTDTVAIFCQTTTKSAPQETTKTKSFDNNNHQNSLKVDHAGKHTLLGELIGQAVYEATTESLKAAIQVRHGGCFRYHYWYKPLLQAKLLLKGSQPMIPPRPRMPVPSPPLSISLIGYTGLILCFVMEYVYFQTSNSSKMSYQQSFHPLPQILALFIWDRCLGSPLPIKLHPVVLVGKLIRVFEKRIFPSSIFDNPVQGFVCGLILLFLVILISCSVTLGLIGGTEYLAHCILQQQQQQSVAMILHLIATFVPWYVQLILLKSCINLQLLCTLALQMATFLERRQIAEARTQLSWLCSRDSTLLQSPELAAATLESLSENLGDSVVSPLFWYMIGWILQCHLIVSSEQPMSPFMIPLLPLLGTFIFKIVNTLDSCVGYRGRNEYYGKASARFDDVLCWIPARLTALYLALAAGILQLFSRSYNSLCAHRGLAIAWRDACQCESPNAGYPMGTLAGILGVQLEKKGHYNLGAKPLTVGQRGGTLPTPSDMHVGHDVAQVAGWISGFVTVWVASIFIFLASGAAADAGQA